MAATPPTDAELLAFVATLERAVAHLYDEARLIAPLDPTVATIAERYANHHRLHAQALEARAGVGPTPANATLLAELSPQLAAAGSTDAALGVVQRGEEALAATHLNALGVLRSAGAAATVSGILPIECEHSVALGTLAHQPLATLVTENGEEPSAAALDPAKYPPA